MPVYKNVIKNEIDLLLKFSFCFFHVFHCWKKDCLMCNVSFISYFFWFIVALLLIWLLRISQFLHRYRQLWSNTLHFSTLVVLFIVIMIKFSCFVLKFYIFFLEISWKCPEILLRNAADTLLWLHCYLLDLYRKDWFPLLSYHYWNPNDWVIKYSLVRLLGC